MQKYPLIRGPVYFKLALFKLQLYIFDLALPAFPSSSVLGEGSPSALTLKTIIGLGHQRRQDVLGVTHGLEHGTDSLCPFPLNYRRITFHAFFLY